MDGLVCDRCQDTLLVRESVRYLLKSRCRTDPERWLGRPREWDLCGPCQRWLLMLLRRLEGPGGAECGHCRGPGGADGAELEVVIEAAYDVLEVTEDQLQQDFEAEWRRLLKQLEDRPEGALQDEIHRRFLFSVCSRCRFGWFHDPFHRLARCAH